MGIQQEFSSLENALYDFIVLYNWASFDLEAKSLIEEEFKLKPAISIMPGLGVRGVVET